MNIPESELSRALARARRLTLVSLGIAVAAIAIALYALVRTRAPASAVRIAVDGTTRVELDEQGLQLFDRKGDVQAKLTADGGGAELALGGKPGAAVSLSAQDDKAGLSVRGVHASASLIASELGAMIQANDAPASVTLSAANFKPGTMAVVKLSAPAPDGSWQETQLQIDGGGQELGMSTQKRGGSLLSAELAVPAVVHGSPELRLAHGVESLSARASEVGPSLDLSDRDGSFWTSPSRPK